MQAWKQNDLVQHLIFWTVYLLATAGSDLVYYPYFLSNLRTNFIMTLPMAGLVYLNLYVLIPRLLMKGKQVLYWFSVIVLSALFLRIVSLVTYELFRFIYYNLDKAEFFWSNEGQVVLGIQFILLFFVSMALFLLKQWYQKEQYARELEEKNLRAELELLKHQVQPHFLFNTLNTIYMLMDKDVADARQALLQFSDILSHQLYDTGKGRIPLEKEFEYLRNYMDIQRLRHEDLLNLDCKLETDNKPYLIAPMLLIVFVENAFKHGQSANGYQVTVSAVVKDHTLYFRVWNSMAPEAFPATKPKAGIGLINVKRRLELLYPDSSELEIRQREEFYEVRLSVQLELGKEEIAGPASIKISQPSLEKEGRD